jgi:hypothetical protein
MVSDRHTASPFGAEVRSIDGWVRCRSRILPREPGEPSDDRPLTLSGNKTALSKWFPTRTVWA